MGGIVGAFAAAFVVTGALVFIFAAAAVVVGCDGCKECGC